MIKQYPFINIVNIVGLYFLRTLHNRDFFHSFKALSSKSATSSDILLKISLCHKLNLTSHPLLAMNFELPSSLEIFKHFKAFYDMGELWDLAYFIQVSRTLQHTYVVNGTDIFLFWSMTLAFEKAVRMLFKVVYGIESAFAKATRHFLILKFFDETISFSAKDNIFTFWQIF